MMPENNSNTMENDSSQCGIKVDPPPQFDFENAASWTKWSKRFERYISISGLTTKAENEKIHILLYLMGDKAEDSVPQFEVKPITLIDMIAAFTNYFEPRYNVIFERYLFNTRTQEDFETVDGFITDLHKLADTSKYGDLKEELIRDRIVVGIRDSEVGRKMQLKADLTLKYAIFISKQAERQHKQNIVMKGAEPKVVEVCAVGKNHFSNDKKKLCFNCGKEFPHNKSCPAKNVECFSCGKMGHFFNVCRSKTQKIDHKKVNLVAVDEDTCARRCNEDNIWGKQSKFSKSIFIPELDSNINFLIDTGSDIDCLPFEMIQKFNLEFDKNVGIVVKNANNVVKFMWSDLDEISFTKIKKSIVDSVHLSFYQKNLPTYVNSDVQTME